MVPPAGRRRMCTRTKVGAEGASARSAVPASVSVAAKRAMWRRRGPRSVAMPMAMEEVTETVIARRRRTA
jgi:hypothetical protein